MRRGLVGLIAAATALAAGVPAAAAGAPGDGGDSCSVRTIEDDGLAQDPVIGDYGVSLSGDGTILAYVTGAGLVIRDLGRSTTRTVPPPSGSQLFAPAVSADGSSVAFVAGDLWLTPHGYLGQLDVYRYDTETEAATRVLDEDGFNLRPALSADGRVVAASNWGQVSAVDVGSGRVVTSDVHNGNWYRTPVSVSPDGVLVTFSTGDDGGAVPAVEVLDVPTGITREVAPLAGSYHPRFLADGRRIVVVTSRDVEGVNPSRQPSLITYDLETGVADNLGPVGPYVEAVVSASGERRADMSSIGVDGQNPEGNMELVSTNLATGDATQLTDTQHGWVLPLASSADGTDIAFASDGVTGAGLFLATTCDPAPRADAQVATAASRRFVGVDVYAVNPTAAQKASAPIAAGASRSFLVRLQNDRTAVDSLTVAGRDAGRPGYRVQYRYLGADVTAEVEAGTFTVGPLDPGGSAVLQVKVTADPDVPAGARHRVDVTARSVANPVAGDTVRARLTASR